KVIHHDDVRVDVAQLVTGRMALRLGKDITHERRAVLIARDFWEMPDTEVGCRLCDALVVPEEYDFAGGPQESPATDRIALDYADVAAKRLGNREERQHFLSSTTRQSRSRTGSSASRKSAVSGRRTSTPSSHELGVESRSRLVGCRAA